MPLTELERELFEVSDHEDANMTQAAKESSEKDQDAN